MDPRHREASKTRCVERHFGPAEMMALHRMADFCIISSLHDGMNLVAKEFVASRNDNDGALLVSEFAGAALELTDAVHFNPFAVDELCERIRLPLEMEPAERKRRMLRMRAAVRENNVYRWAGKILSALRKVDAGEPSEGRTNVTTHHWDVQPWNSAALSTAKTG